MSRLGTVFATLGLFRGLFVSFCCVVARSDGVGVLELFEGGSTPGGARAWGRAGSQEYDDDDGRRRAAVTRVGSGGR